MTPERAAELLDKSTNKGEELKAQIVEAILQACAEQRETDAKICRAQGDKAGDDYEAGGCYGCETAIREGK